jgi:uncharacterized protein (TIGR01777 family)
MGHLNTIIVTGATGLIGRALVAELAPRYHVVAFVRDVDRARKLLPETCELVHYALGDSSGFEKKLDGAAAVVNLAGEPLFKPFTGHRALRRVTQERIDGSKRLAQACGLVSVPPRVFVQASSVGVYGFGAPAPDMVAENSRPLPGEHSEGSRAWEHAASDNLPSTRVALLRLGYVLASNGGGLQWQLAEARKGKVGFFRPGTQWLPWIHLADVISVIVSAIEDEAWKGPYNVVAPEAVTSAQFANTLAHVTGARSAKATPRMFAHLFLGAGAMTVLGGRRVVPERLLEQGYPFRYPKLQPALQDLVATSS